MGKCERCEGDNGLSYTCNECGGTFCTQHRLPEAHNCEALRTNSPGWFNGSTDTQDDPDTHGQESTESAKCLECDRITNQTCDDCGGAYCKRHKYRRAHSCAFLGSDIGPDKDETTEHADSDGSGKTITDRLRPILLLPIVLLTTVVRAGTRLLTAPLRNPKLGVLVLVLVAGSGLAVTGQLDDAVAAYSEATTINETQVEILVHERINEIRTDRGLSPLHHDPALREIASEYSERMATEGFYSHVDPAGHDFQNRYATAGYSCRVPISDRRYATGGENINIVNAFVETTGRNGRGSYYADTEEEVANVLVRQWMNSPGHRENILETYWNNEGIGVYVIENPDSSGMKVYATQNFC